MTLISYTRKVQLYVPDTLSRASLSTTSGPAASKTTDVFSLEIESISLTDNIDVQDEQLEKIKQHTNNDPVLRKIMLAIINGWPHHKSEIPPEIKTISLRKRRAHMSKRTNIQGRPHSYSTQNAQRNYTRYPYITRRNRILRTARAHGYWLRITAEIKEHCKKCEICQSRSMAKQQNETLISHEISERPWKMYQQTCLRSMVLTTLSPWIITQITGKWTNSIQ